MATAIILSIGSRGDTEPTIALATKLLKSIDKVHIFHFSNFTDLIPDNPHIISHPLPFSVAVFPPIFKRQLVRAVLLSLFSGFDMVKIQTAAMGDLITQYVIPLLPDIITLAEEIHPSLIISTTLGFTIATSLADKFDIPVCFLNFQPNTPTTAYPYYMHSTDTAILAADQITKLHQHPSNPPNNPEHYFQTYQTQYSMFTSSLPALNTIRASYGLEELLFTDLEDSISGKLSNVHVLNSFCMPLVPSAPDHTDNIHIVPPLASAYLPQNWDPEQSCPEVVEYLSKGEKPVCVTFGSMGGIVSSASVTRQLLNGLRAAGVQRALILNSTTNIGTENLWRFRDADLIEWTKRHVLVTKEVPQYAWLLPHCKAIICHGGAGTTFAGLRAGIPVIISPVLCDQFFWGKLVENLGLGAVAGPRLERATRDSFEQAVRKALTDEVVQRVRKVGEVERRNGDGANMAAEIITSLIPQLRE